MLELSFAALTVTMPASSIALPRCGPERRQGPVTCSPSSAGSRWMSDPPRLRRVTRMTIKAQGLGRLDRQATDRCRFAESISDRRAERPADTGREADEGAHDGNPTGL